MQYSAGTATFTSGSQTVTFVGADPQTYMQVGDEISPIGSNVWYQIAAIHATLPQITMVEPYVGTTVSGQPYVVQAGFTPNLNLPYPEQDDIETASIVKRALFELDVFVGNFIGQTITAGSVIFGKAGGGGYAQDNASLNFNDGTNTLNVANLVVNGTTSLSGAVSLAAASAANSVVTIGGAPSVNNAFLMPIVVSNSQINWRIQTNVATAGALELAPSTAAGGSTWAAPAFTLTNASLTVARLLGIKQGANTIGSGLRLIRSDSAVYYETYIGADNNYYIQFNGGGVYTRFTTAGGADFSAPLTITTATETHLTLNGATTLANRIVIGNTSGNLLLGVERASGNGLFVGAVAYSGGVGTVTNTPFHIAVNNTVMATFLATTGTTLIAAPGSSTLALAHTGSSAGDSAILDLCYGGSVTGKIARLKASVQGGGGGDLEIQTAPSVGGAYVTALKITQGGVLSVQLNGTERATFGTGFFKASNTGAYYGVSGAYHEFRSSLSDQILLMSNSNAVPFGITMIYTAAAPNNTGSYFFLGSDTTTTRIVLASNGGLHNFSANNVNLSDELAKRERKRADAMRYYNGHRKLEYITFLYNDQTDGIFNLGLGARQTGEIFPELLTVFTPATETQPERKGLFETDVFYMHGVVLQKVQEYVDEHSQSIEELLAFKKKVLEKYPEFA